jgi:large subunit ribosomal protein L4
MGEEGPQTETVKLPLYSAEQSQIGEFEALSRVFGHEGSAATMHEVVLMQLANRRAGTVATKTRGLVSGGGIKPWRQKGTGRARAGSTRSPLWRHGGTVFGPQPRDYSYKLPRKQRAKALCLALSERAREGKLLVIERLEIERPKTKLAKALLDKLGLQHALVVVGDGEEEFIRAARNLARYKVLRVVGLNVYDVLNFAEVLLTVKAAQAIQARFQEAV